MTSLSLETAPSRLGTGPLLLRATVGGVRVIIGLLVTAEEGGGRGLAVVARSFAALKTFSLAFFASV